jgi:hypothetical protein
MSDQLSVRNYRWQNMLHRCNHKNDRFYHRYGGRGIRICRRWRESVAAFISDIGRRPSPKHMLDREDNDGHYSCGKCSECRRHGWPANCRWVTPSESCNNKGNNRRLTIDGVTRTLAEWSAVTGVRRGVIDERLRRGWSPSEAVFTPVAGQRRA